MEHEREAQIETPEERGLSQVEKFTRGLRNLILDHAEGKPVYAEMAARIEARIQNLE